MECEWDQRQGADGLRQPSSRIEVYLDPELNFLARVLIREHPGGHRIQRSVTDQIELAPGSFFPTLVVDETVIEGKTVHRATIKLSEVKKLTEPAADLFELTIPSGTKVFDRRTMSEYESDGRGGVAGETRPIRLPAPPVGTPIDARTRKPIVAGGGPTASSTIGSPSEAETPSRWPWLFWGALVLTLVGAGLWLRGRWRGVAPRS